MQNLYISELGIKYLSECLSRYNGNTGYLVLFFVITAFLFLKGTEKEKRIFVPLSIIMILTVYNPVFPVVVAKFTDVSNEYYRFFWITPVVILVPYALTKIITDSSYNKKLVVCLVIACAVFTCNLSYFTNMQFAENIYKVPDELIEISEIIHSDCEDEYPKAFLDFDYNMMMRQYDPKMLLTIDREDYIYASSHDYTTDEIYDDEHPEYKLLAALFRYQTFDTLSLVKAFEDTSTEYVVLQKGSTNIERLLSVGLTEIAETDSRVILKYNLWERKPFELVDYSEVYRNGW